MKIYHKQIHTKLASRLLLFDTVISSKIGWKLSENSRILSFQQSHREFPIWWEGLLLGYWYQWIELSICRITDTRDSQENKRKDEAKGTSEAIANHSNEDGAQPIPYSYCGLDEYSIVGSMVTVKMQLCSYWCLLSCMNDCLTYCAKFYIITCVFFSLFPLNSLAIKGRVHV